MCIKVTRYFDINNEWINSDEIVVHLIELCS